MAEYISTFITGFNSIIESAIKRTLRGKVIIKHIFDGLVHYNFNGNPEALNSLPCLNNTFLVINSFSKKQLNFSNMVFATKIRQHSQILNRGTFRVRFSNMNKFEGVSHKISSAAEQKICSNSQMCIDRVNPNTEFWYIIRSEGVGYLGQLLYKRIVTEKTLHKGELRPEFAFLLCCLADVKPSDVVCDPFAGYGAIPQQIVKSFQCKKIYISDNNKDAVNHLKNKFKAVNSVHILKADARNLAFLEDNSINSIITDPPWGFYEDINNITEFYIDCLLEMERITKENSLIVIVTAKKSEFEAALQQTKLILKEKLDTLVNGKKSSVFVLRVSVTKKV